LDHDADNHDDQAERMLGPVPIVSVREPGQEWLG